MEKSLLITYPALGLCGPGDAHKHIERGVSSTQLLSHESSSERAQSMEEICGQLLEAILFAQRDWACILSRLSLDIAYFISDDASP